MNIKKAFLGVLIALILVPSVSVAADRSALETQRIELMKQVIVLLQTRVQQLQILLAQKYGITSPTVLGAATSTIPTETPKKRRGGGGGGGGGGGSRNNPDPSPVVETPATSSATSTPTEPEPEEPTVEELQAQVNALIVTINDWLAEDDKTLGECELIGDTSSDPIENLQMQIAQLMAVINQLQSGETTFNGCPVFNIGEEPPAALVLTIDGEGTTFTVDSSHTLNPKYIEVVLQEFDDDVIPLEITLLAKVSDGTTLEIPLVKDSDPDVFAHSADMRARLASGLSFTGEFEVIFPETISHGMIKYLVYYKEAGDIVRTINLVKPRTPNPLGTELDFSLGSGSPDATDIVVDENHVTQGVTVLEYTIQA